MPEGKQDLLPLDLHIFNVTLRRKSLYNPLSKPKQERTALSLPSLMCIIPSPCAAPFVSLHTALGSVKTETQGSVQDEHENREEVAGGTAADKNVSSISDIFWMVILDRRGSNPFLLRT